MGWHRVAAKVAAPQSNGVEPGSERLDPKHHWGTVMEYYVGIDVSLKSVTINEPWYQTTVTMLFLK